MKKSIVLDLDGVVADIDTAISEYLHYDCGVNVDYSKWLTTNTKDEEAINVMNGLATMLTFILLLRESNKLRLIQLKNGLMNGILGTIKFISLILGKRLISLRRSIRSLWLKIILTK